MNKIELSILRDKLNNISGKLYNNDQTAIVALSFELDKIIDEINAAINFFEGIK